MLSSPPFALPNGIHGDLPQKRRDGRRTTIPKALPALSPQRQPKAVPLPPSHITRTKSELQLDEDLHAAEWRDRCMFQRLVVGIRERQQRQAHRLMVARQQELLGGKAPSCDPSGGAWSALPAAHPHPRPRKAQVLPEPQAVSPSLPSDSPYASPAPPEVIGAVAPRQHLQTVLRRASTLADEALDAVADDWSISGFEEDVHRGCRPHVQQPSANAYTQPPPQLLQFYQGGQYGAQPYVEPEQDEMEGEIFNLEL